MKKFILSLLLVVAMAGTALAVTGYPQTFKVKKVTLTSANAKYSEPISSAGIVQMQSRTAADFKIGHSEAEIDQNIYYTVKSGTVYQAGPLAVDDLIYFQSATAGQILEIMYWQ